MKNWEILFHAKISGIATSEDPAHDILHFIRVVKTAKQLCESEGGRPEVVIPAAWLHDFVIIPKNNSRRSMASRLASAAAIEFLSSIGYPEEYYKDIAHAIECHSFSANIPAETLEAKIVQDADRLDGLGAIGIARCFATAGMLKSTFYSFEDPFCETRAPNDRVFTVDHFFAKLFKTADTLQTASGRALGKRRVDAMKTYLKELALEI
ncbi:MAG: HD domain-containing protein [Bdellovibrionaceae bacterium]|nr:HD domain-containing protein [Pseudobdellovibrionaceae bacterium]